MITIMATVNFSVPEKVKKAFNQVFKGQNKSAVIARLMEQAVEEAARQEQRARAMREILKRRQHARPVTEKQVQQTRQALRK